MTEIRARGRLPIVVGGTHYYTQSLLFKDTLVGTEETDNAGAASEAERKTESQKWPILEESGDIMLEKLREIDPIMASRWHPNETRKIRRSLEIWLQTGKKASDVYEIQEQRRKAGNETAHGTVVEGEGESSGVLPQPSDGLRFPSLIFWVHVPREISTDRLDARVDEMVQAGLLEEAHGLNKYAQEREETGESVDKTRGIYAAVGYKEFCALFDALQKGVNETSVLNKLEAEGVEMTKVATRRYAKTQLRWIRIKLINALQEAGAKKSIMVLDASSPTIWSTLVLDPAVKRTQAFLGGEELPKDDTLGPSELLAPLRNYDLGRRRELWQQQVCDICKVTTVTEEDWEKHIHGSRHRRANKSYQKRHTAASNGRGYCKALVPQTTKSS